MIGYVRRRLVSIFVAFAVASLVIFMIVRLIPGDAAAVIATSVGTPEQMEAIREQLGLNEPIVTQYFVWLGDAVTGELGRSFTTQLPVATLIAQRLPATLALAAVGLSLALVFGVLGGLLAALNRGKLIDSIVTTLNVVSLGMPTFWLGFLILIFFGLQLGWFPIYGYVPISEGLLPFLKHVAMPAGTLAFAVLPTITWLVRDSVLANLNSEPIRGAHSFGIRPWTINSRYLLRASLAPVITMLGVISGRLISGAVVVETVFAWPGLGSLAVDAVLSHDYPTVQATVLLAVAMFVLANLAADLVHAGIDPRVREG